MANTQTHHSFENQFIVAANWKMNKTPMEAMAFVAELKPLLKLKANHRALFFPSFLSLQVFKQEFQGTAVLFGAQNCHFADSGAFTGEVSAPMLKSVGVNYCLVGHSERRHIFGESDEVVAKKVLALQKSGITPMICIGETEKQKMDGQTLTIVQKQIEESLRLGNGQEVIFAYEPVWAIGTGKVPTLEEITEVHAFIRKQLIRHMGDAGGATPILYGGSVTAQNAKEISSAGEVNGFLIGGASLKTDSYTAIYQS